MKYIWREADILDRKVAVGFYSCFVTNQPIISFNIWI